MTDRIVELAAEDLKAIAGGRSCGSGLVERKLAVKAAVSVTLGPKGRNVADVRRLQDIAAVGVHNSSAQD